MKSTYDVCQRLEFDAQVYGEYSQSIKKFSHSLWTFITTEVDAQAHLFSPLCQVLEGFSDCNASICKEIQRAIDDLRDIAERNVVVQRKISEHASLINQYENAKLKVEEAKSNFKLYESRPDFYLKKEYLENSIKKLENEQREATIKARDGTLSLIEYKKKIASFTTRRTKSCFERLGNAFKMNSEQSIIFLNRFLEGLKAIKNEEPLPNFVLYGQDSVPEEFKQEIKTNIISENENEYILCEKVNVQKESNNVNDSINKVDDNDKESHSNKNQNSNNDIQSDNLVEENSTENDSSVNQKDPISSEINTEIGQKESTSTENTIIVHTEKTSSNEKDKNLLQNGIEANENSDNQKKDSLDVNYIYNSQEEIDATEKNDLTNINSEE